MTRGQKIFAGLFSMALTAALVDPAFATVATNTIYGSYTDGVTNHTSGDTPPMISLSGGLQSPFTVSGLYAGGPVENASSGGGLLFTVVPAGCINSGCGGGTETATISVDFSFYTSGGTLLGTVSDTAQATFNYSNDTDNLCWLNSGVSNTNNILVSSGLVGTCYAPGSHTTPTAYEQIEVNLSGLYYDVNLYDWNDWNEMPKINFQQVNPPTRAPEPASLALLGAGLLGLGGLLGARRRRKAAAQIA